MNQTSRPISPDLDYLRPFDAVPPTAIDQTTTIRAEARLHQILASPQRQPGPVTSRPPRRTWALRLAAIPVAAAAAIGIGLALPHSPSVPTAQAALATWHSDPTEMTADRLAVAETACRNAFGGGADLRLQEEVYALLSNSPLVAEQRGAWDFLVYPGDDWLTISCMVLHTEPGTAEVVAAARFVPRLASSHFPSGLVASARGFTPDGGLMMTSPYVLSLGFTDGNALSAMFGPVDPNVSAVTVHSATAGDVVATVANGWYVAWWPVGIDTTDETGFSFVQLGTADSLTVTRTDGTTEQVPLSFPSVG